MVRARHLDISKVLLVHPAHVFQSLHGAGTFAGLFPPLGPRIMDPCGSDSFGSRNHRPLSGSPYDLSGAPPLFRCHVESVLALMRPKPLRFLLPCWLGPAGSDLPLAPRRCPTAVMLDLIRSVLHNLYVVQSLIQWGGTLLVCIIVFVETGLFVGFFLPGDSLLVTAGVFGATGVLKIGTLLPVV